MPGHTELRGVEPYLVALSSLLRDLEGPALLILWVVVVATAAWGTRGLVEMVEGGRYLCGF